MPTTVISFLGTGQKLNQTDTRSNYRTATYRFSNNGNSFDQTTSLFGTALIRYLHSIGSNIDKWIVLGTSASVWSELNQVLNEPDQVLEEYCSIDDRVISRTVDSPSLDQWQSTLNQHLTIFQIRLCLTGEALNPNSQMEMAQSLFREVPKGNHLVFDITHGFRHQPVIATFMLSLMRWTHSIQQISFYSGVFEAREGDITPVLELPICQELVKATEAAAVLELSGNYEPIAKCLEMNAEMSWFFENTNQIGNAKNQALSLKNPRTDCENVIQNELAKLLQERLQWTSGDAFASRVQQSAKAAIEHGDYFRSVILIYEAIIIRTVQLIDPNKDPLDYQIREYFEEKLKNKLLGDNTEVFKNLQWTRNACAHGSRSNKYSAQQILSDPKRFKEMIQSSFELYESLPLLLKA